MDPAHAVRVPAGPLAVRALLKAVLPTATQELFWRGERAHPAGNTALQFTQPHLAEQLTFARLDDTVKSGAQIAITEDAGTLDQLNCHAARFGVRVQGLYELLAASNQSSNH